MTFPVLFDYQLLARRLNKRSMFNNFFFQDISARLRERLSFVKKNFLTVVDIGGIFKLSPLNLQIERIWTVSRVYNQEIDIVSQSDFFPFAQNSIDCVISCLDLQWENDVLGTLIQVRNILKSDGMFLCAFLGGDTLHELRQCLLEAESEMTGGASLRVGPFIPLRDFGGLMQRAGFSLPVIDLDRIVIEYPDIFSLMKDLRQYGGGNVSVQRLKHFTPRHVFMRAADLYQRKYGLENGRIPVTLDVIYGIGWVPHSAQPQPLKPGSARVHLAQVLPSSIL